MQERLESSPAGRLLISAFLVVTVLALVAWNLPASELRRQALRPLAPYVRATGLDQNWGVFAPDPRRQTLDFYARITYADGTTGTWRPPSGNALIGAYRDYRWRKWYEWTTNDSYRHLWDPAAAFVARRERAAGREPVRVELVRRTSDLAAPGYKPRSGPWREETYHSVLEVAVP